MYFTPPDECVTFAVANRETYCWLAGHLSYKGYRWRTGDNLNIWSPYPYIGDDCGPLYLKVDPRYKTKCVFSILFFDENTPVIEVDVLTQKFERAGGKEPELYSYSLAITDEVGHLISSPTPPPVKRINNPKKMSSLSGIYNKVRGLSKSVARRRKYDVELLNGSPSHNGRELLLEILYQEKLPEIDKHLEELEKEERKK